MFKTKNLLWITASCKETDNLDSLSSRIGKMFIQYLYQNKIISKVRERNVNLIPHIDYNTVSKMYKSSKESENKESKKENNYESTASFYLVNEFLNSDVIVISTPMYNFGCPSALKAWIDHIVVVNQTFKYDKTGPRGLCTNKVIYLVITSGGGCEEGGEGDFISTYLKYIFKFIGCEDVRVIWINNTNSRSEEELFKIATYQIRGIV
jgi:FMN-dependent NADH-azoreductase